MAIVVNPLENAIVLLQDFGFFSVILPMLLVFAVFYGILMKTKIFGSHDEAQYINAVIAFVAAFFVVTSTEVVNTINTFLPNASFLLILVMLFLMILSFFGIKTETAFGSPSRWIWGIVIILVIIFLGILDYSAGWEVPVIHQFSEGFIGGGDGDGGGGSDELDERVSQAISIAIFFSLPILVIWFIARKPGSS